MALAKFNTGEVANKGRAVALLSPADNMPIGIRFYVLGVDSREFQRLQRQWEKEDFEQQKKLRRGIYQPSPELREERALTLLSTMTTGWDEDVKDEEGKVVSVRKEIELDEGNFVPFSPEAARAIYSDLGYRWIREQIDTEIGDRRDFLPQGNRN